MLELKRRNFEVYYWKSQREKEVDFVIKKDEQIKQLLQVCVSLSDEKNKKREKQALIECSEYTKCKDLLIITQDYENKEKYKDKVIKYIPLWKWLLESV